jgi:hypothetical protein
MYSIDFDVLYTVYGARLGIGVSPSTGDSRLQQAVSLALTFPQTLA